ncbi:PRC-barrel domain-containing protein [Pseudotabrizicola formosa]|uniref:PRC-barrel domain-containing protein n=1 Tax=Pseudotabrizicola formosa TaxID=2030009 RepID=UPI000CD26B9B|nr:PRC-barrel domain-containing protein [Pseudotabrizicola formosa]
MKLLFASTALVTTFALSTGVFAQTNATTGAEILPNDAPADRFMAGRAPQDLVASELLGQNVYARPPATPAADSGADAATALGAGQGDTNQTTAQPEGGHIPEAYAARNSDGTNNLALMSEADLEGLDNIGQVEDIVLSNDGRVVALVVNVGGFVGSGDQRVALTMDQVSYSTDSEDPNRIYVVVTTPSDTLANAPNFAADRATGQTGLEGTVAP